MRSSRSSLGRMRLLATGLLILMVAVFIAAHRYDHLHPAVGYVQAFAEAATVGALADWFAVTALFRRPLGLPIPHTAIIPRSKDRIGAGLGRFLESNFLSAELLSERLAGVDLLGEASTWLTQPGRAALVARAAADGLPRLLDLMDDEPVERALRDLALNRLRHTDVSTVIGNALSFLTSEGRHQGVLDHFIRAADALLNESEADIRARIRAESGWIARTLALDKRAADAIVAAARGAIRDMAADPGSDIRKRFEAALRRFADDLRTSPELRAEIEAIKMRAFEHPEVQALAGAIWRDVKADLRARSERGEPNLAGPLESAILGFAVRMRRDEALRTLLNERLRTWATRLAASRGGDVSRFVADTIQSWDARTIIGRIEEGVGADLQYIRISGTLIGGLVGLAIHGFKDVMG